MTVWDLSRLRYTVRKITGKYDVTQLPDDTNNVPGSVSFTNPPGIDDYINDFYLYDMPEHFRTLRLRDFYNFVTIPNCGTYNVPQNVVQIYDPIYIDNYQFAWYQFPEVFYRIWPELNFIDRNLFNPDSNTVTFNFTLSQAPVQQGTVIIGLQPNLDNFPSQSPALEVFRDTDQPIPLDVPLQQKFVNPGTLLSNQYTGTLPLVPGTTPGTGLIDYLTGEVTLVYTSAPPAGTNSSCHYHPYVASRPRDILFWQQQLFLRPIPNDTYAVKCMAYVLPTTVMNAATNAKERPSLYTNPSTGEVSIQGFSGVTGNPAVQNPASDLPQFNEWWQLIAYGAALKIFIEDGDHEEYARNKVYFEEQKLLAQRKTIKQFASQRIQTPYAENVSGPAFPIFPIY